MSQLAIEHQIIVGQENSEYFAIGSDIVKCSDYINVHIVVELTNNREELFTTNLMAWSAEMEDGYKLNFNSNNYSDVQIQSGSTAKVELDILKENTVKGDKIILTYTDINYDDTYTEFFQKALGGSTEEELRKDYPQYFDESLQHTFEVSLSKIYNSTKHVDFTCVCYMLLLNCYFVKI